jgi:gamma-glutamyltranspeptidase
LPTFLAPAGSNGGAAIAVRATSGTVSKQTRGLGGGIFTAKDTENSEGFHCCVENTSKLLELNESVKKKSEDWKSVSNG